MGSAAFVPGHCGRRFRPTVRAKAAAWSGEWSAGCTRAAARWRAV